MTQPTAAAGLSSADAARALIEFGANELESAPDVSPIMLFLRQFTSPVIWLLLGAGVVSGVLGEVLDAGASDRFRAGIQSAACGARARVNDGASRPRHARRAQRNGPSCRPSWPS